MANRIEKEWRDYLAEQNEELTQFGDNSISVEQDEDGYYSVFHTIDGKTEEIASNCFEDEVNGCIDMARGYIVGYRAGSEAAVSDPALLAHPSMRNCFNRKEVENMVMLSADLYRRLYDSEQVGGGSLEVAALIIEHGCKMERWLTEKYGKDDEEYLDRLEEYEAMVEREYDLDRLKATAQPVETDFYSIKDDGKGGKQIHIMGFSYLRDEEPEWGNVECTFCIEPLAEFIEHTKQDEGYATDLASSVKQYQGDYTTEEMTDICNHYFGGKTANKVLCYSEITMDTPCGDYVTNWDD